MISALLRLLNDYFVISYQSTQLNLKFFNILHMNKFACTFFINLYYESNSSMIRDHVLEMRVSAISFLKYKS